MFPTLGADVIWLLAQLRSLAGRAQPEHHRFAELGSVNPKP